MHSTVRHYLWSAWRGCAYIQHAGTRVVVPTHPVWTSTNNGASLLTRSSVMGLDLPKTDDNVFVDKRIADGEAPKECLQNTTTCAKHNMEITSSLTPQATSSVETIATPGGGFGDQKTEKVCPDLACKLDKACQTAFEMNRPTEEDLLRRHALCRELETHLKEQCHQDIQLELFGSSVNGFTFNESDLDICLTFRGYDTDEKVSKNILTPVMEAIKLHHKFYSVKTFYRAQVPIVKFHVRGEKFDSGDISLYNKLAVANTKLLSAYATVDHRCRALGYMLKHFMKCCENQRLRTYTSYAYILLVIYFLQQCDPPVLPVLQDMHESKKRPGLILEGWNVWFYKDIEKIPEVWDGYGKNNFSVGELWFQMLYFYAEIFDFENQVICVRRKRPMSIAMKINNISHLSLTRNPLAKRKLHGDHWTNRRILVEDPFDLRHNLTASMPKSTSVEFISLLEESCNKLQKIAAGKNAHKAEKDVWYL